MTEAEYNALVSSINQLKNETNDGAITPTRLGGLLANILTGLWGSIPSSSTYALKSWVTSTINSTIADVALKDDIPSLTGYALQSWVTSNFASVSKVNSISSAVSNLGIKKTTNSVDSIKSTGRYYLETGGPTEPCYLEVMASYDNFVVQRSTSNTGDEIKRVFNGSTWSEWK